MMRLPESPPEPLDRERELENEMNHAIRMELDRQRVELVAKIPYAH